MSFIEKNIQDLTKLDLMARGTTSAHRRDPRINLLVTVFFILAVISMNKYSISQLMPFFLYPVTLLGTAHLPPRYFIKKILLAAPFAIMIGIANPFFDRETILCIGSWGISGGWVSFLSILIRFILTVGTCVILIGITGFQGLCLALQQLHVPRIFVTQLLFLYRYIFVLLDEVNRVSKAHTLRSIGPHHPGISMYASLVGHLLLRSSARAERIYLAMVCRGFNGTIPIMRPTRIHLHDGWFLCGWILFFILSRLYNIPLILGSFIITL